jgi:hypothetical protein
MLSYLQTEYYGIFKNEMDNRNQFFAHQLLHKYESKFSFDFVKAFRKINTFSMKKKTFSNY